MVNLIGKLVTITGRAARIGIQHDVASGRVQLIFNTEMRAVGGERPTVNLKNQWILLIRIKFRWRDDPALHLMIANRRWPGDFLHAAQRFMRQQIVVQIRQFRWRSSPSARCNLGRSIRAACRIGVGAIIRNGKTTARIWPADAGTTNIVREQTNLAAHRQSRQIAFAVIVILYVKTVRTTGPPDSIHRPIKLRRQFPG